VQTAILTVLGIDLEGVTISTGLAWNSPYAILLVSDPVGALLVDGQGRRLGWTPDTGALDEMPNSVWFGEGDGFGVVYGEVPPPLRVELVGLGDDHVVQVVGEQGRQRIGLHDDSPLAGGETRSVAVEVRDAPGPAALDVGQAASTAGQTPLDAGQAAESAGSTSSVLLIVLAVLVGLIVLVLAALVLALARQRRRA
jgi:hypothetical protein